MRHSHILGTALALALGVGSSTLYAQMSLLEGNDSKTDACESAKRACADTQTAANALEGADNASDTNSGPPDIACNGKGVCVEQTTQLPMRVLPRPLSNLYREARNDPNAVVKANLPAFRPLYVFAKQGIDLSDPAAPKGWYQVGTSTTQAQGWLAAADALEWRQALVLSYTHPGGVKDGRKPVLMFRDQASLRTIVESAQRGTQTEQLYQQIDSGQIPASVVSMEPKRFVDITQQFYLLPILNWDNVDINGDDVRLLQLAAALPRERGATPLKDQDYLKQATTARDADQGAELKKLKIDVVFVIDTTKSMQPYIDMTTQAVGKMVRSFDKSLEGRVKFGLIGYRDSLQKVPNLEYASKNFTPNLVDGKQALALLDKQFKATSVGSFDYAEEVFAGVDEGLRSNWTDGALRFVVLIGDASSHPKGHEQNTTQKDATDLRRELDDNQVHVLAVHLEDARAAEDHTLAREQFTELSKVRGAADSSALVLVDVAKEADFQAAVDKITSQISGRLQQSISAAGGAHTDNTTVVSTDSSNPESTTNPDQQAKDAVDKLWQAALVEYLGKDADPPKDIVVWVADRDLLNPADKALEVRVLITREQLSSLTQALDHVVQAFMSAEVSQGQFFEALQNVSGQTLKRPDDVSQAQKLGNSGLLPAFITSLPYKSDILALSDEMYASMSAEQRSQLEWSILAKLQQYRAINEQVDAWVRLNDGDSDSQMVYPLHIDYLP